MNADADQRIAALRIDETDLPPPSPETEQERNIAVFDLLETNVFCPVATPPRTGPYDVTLGLRARHLVLDIADARGDRFEITLPQSAFRKRAREYLEVCESYFEAVRGHTPDAIAALDEARKALHNEGAETLCTRLEPDATVDDQTARRLFTLVCSLVYKG